ncbi:unnamed protein product [Anisakis simplex]|uniref:DET1- and DDB1-associated protein 1 n=1 Tax=Anisakis simplex TaxID=6269 RepID=A0A0M3K1F3_ANISI|nr:unnamed protein product [Anisakis simplex]
MASSKHERRHERKKHRHGLRERRANSRRYSENLNKSTSNKFDSLSARDNADSGVDRLKSSEGTANEQQIDERKSAKSKSKTSHNTERSTDIHYESDDLRKRFDESLKKALNRSKVNLIKGENSEQEEIGLYDKSKHHFCSDDDLAEAMQTKTVQEVITSTSRVLLNDERIEPATVQLQMRVNNIKGHTQCRPTNVYFNAYVRELVLYHLIKKPKPVHDRIHGFQSLKKQTCCYLKRSKIVLKATHHAERTT